MSSKEHLIETIQATYCAKSSEEVREAERNVFASLRDNKVLAMLGKMLETHNDHKLKQSISSLILRHVLNINARLDLEPLWLVDCFNKLKDIVNNFHISAVYKRPFCTALCLLIKKVSTSSIDQLITNTIYYYSIHQDTVAIMLTQSLFKTSLIFAVQICLYKQAVYLFFQRFHALLVRRKNISQDNEAISSEDSKMADYYLEIFHEILMDMNFQKYESFAHVLLDSPFLATILQDLTIRPWSSQCWTQSIEIQSKIVQGLSLSAVNQHSNLLKMISETAQGQYQQLLVIIEKTKDTMVVDKQTIFSEINTYRMSFLISCVQHCVLSFQFSVTFILQICIFANARIFCASIDCFQDQISLTLEDCCYLMESNATEVLFNKLIFTLLTKQSQSQGLFKQIIMSLLFQNLDSNYYSVVNQSFISLQCNEPVMSQLESALLGLPLQVKIFLKDISSLNTIQQFVNLYGECLLTMPSKTKLNFLAFLFVYADDIYLPPSIIHLVAYLAIGDDQSIKVLAQSVTLNLISLHMPLPITAEKTTLISSFIAAPQIQLLPVVVRIISLYPEEVNDNDILSVMEIVFQMLQMVTISDDLAKKVQSLHQCTCALFESNQWMRSAKRAYELFTGVISQQSAENHALLQRISKHIVHSLKMVPQQIECLAIDLPIDLRDSEQMAFMLTMVRNSRRDLQSQVFINKLLKKCIASLAHTDQPWRNSPVYATLVVHSILYYHHESLTDSALLELVSVVYELCLRLANRFDYVTGKLYLIYLLLLRHQMIRVTAILERLSLLDEIYQLIYGNHNAYRFEYDVPIFVSSQLAILTHHIDYGKQLQYANISFIAIFNNLERCSLTQINNSDKTDFEDTLATPMPIQIEAKEVEKALSIFSESIDFRATDEFRLFKDFIQRLVEQPESNSWLQDMKETVFSPTMRANFYKILQIRMVKGSLRTILAVKRN